MQRHCQPASKYRTDLAGVKAGRLPALPGLALFNFKFKTILSHIIYPINLDYSSRAVAAHTL
jgi:hypothetical protein